jgi:serine/threonine protein kinase
MAEHSPNDLPAPLSDPLFSPDSTELQMADGELRLGDSPQAAIPNSPSAMEELRIPGYEILGELGRGGMGIVFKARQLSLKRLVALKMVLPQGLADPDARARFRAEAEAVAALQHPNIVQIYEIGEYRGRPYFALELVGGGSLADRVARGVFAPEDAARMVQTLAEAVYYAHQHDVIHRDLKPANVLLTEDGTPKISDFGLAKQLRAEAARTRTGVILGSPGYMAPEQAQGKGKDVGPATDIYGLGAILYDLLTGQSPHATDDWCVALRQMVLGEVTPPTRLRPTIPAALEAICLKCLEKEPHRRYPSAHALAVALGRFLSGAPADFDIADCGLRIADSGAIRNPSRTDMLPAELQQLLRDAEPGAVLVPPLAFERVLRETGKPLAPSTLPGLHGGPVVDRHVLFKYVEQEELFLDPEQLLPPTVVLLPAPPAERLEPRARKRLLSDYWRVLFNARIRLHLRERSSSGLLSPADVTERRERIGTTEFAEIRSVLTEEGCLPAEADDGTVYIEFAALYLELRYFAADLLPSYFPGLPPIEVIDALLAEDLDAPALFEGSRLPGAVYPAPRTTAILEESHDYFLKLRQAAEREARANRTVSAAILHTRAARVAPADKAPETRREAERDLQRLGVRLRDALQLTAAETNEWLRYLTPLLDKSDQGSRPVEATLLYDLERVCSDQENEIYALDAVSWGSLSWPCCSLLPSEVVRWGTSPLSRNRPSWPAQ